MIESAILFCLIIIAILGGTLYKLIDRFDSYRLLTGNKIERLEDMIGSLNIKTDKHGLWINSAQSFSQGTQENLNLLTAELGYQIINKGKQIEKVVNDV